LWLFDDQGILLDAQDDIGGDPYDRQSLISHYLTSAGIYYLGITKFGVTPTNYSYDLSNQDPLTGWQGHFSTSAGPSDLNNRSGYQISLSHLSDVPPVPVPTPALLPGLVGMGLSVWRKRKEESLV
jgi:hypothetical protein